MIGLQTLRAVIEAGRPYCDISFIAEDATQLSSHAGSVHTDGLRSLVGSLDAQLGERGVRFRASVE